MYALQLKMDFGTDMRKSLLYFSIISFLALTACGGGGGDNGQASTVPAQPDTPPEVSKPEETLKKINETRLTDVANSLNMNDFNLGGWNPRAISVHDDVIYVANDQNPASVLRYDLKNKQPMQPLQGNSITGINTAWNRMYDLNIHENRLYTASLSSNRVDVFDISSSEPQFIMSMGTGSWSGDQENLALVHPVAVAANDQFVFVADTHNRINVWKQSDVVSSNHLKARKFARLSLPNCGSIYCNVRLETIDDLLYASFDNGQTLAYDVSDIREGATGTEVAAKKQADNIANVFSYADDGHVYASRANGKVDQFDLNQFKATTNLVSDVVESFREFKFDGQADVQNMLKPADFTINSNRIFSIFNSRVNIIPLQKVEQYQSVNNSISMTELKQEQAVSQQLILQDGENWETLTDPKQRYFKINRIISGYMDNDGLLIKNYSVAPVKDLNIEARLKNTDRWFNLVHIDELKALSYTRLNLKLNENQYYKLLDGSGSIKLSGINKFKQLPVDLLDIRVSSKSDTLVQKLSTIKPEWGIYFGKYSQADGQWEKINPIYAREWIIMITNFAYILSSPEFEHVWFNHKQTMGHDFFGNAGQVSSVGGYFTAQEYRRYFDEIMNRGDIRLGITTIGGGLGGGDILGIDTWYFYSHYFNADIGVIGHEFGHHWGSHDSAWANGSYGIQAANLWLHQYFQRKGQLPYMDPELNAFHKASKDQLYNGINESMRQHRPANQVNRLETYFKEHPLK